MRNKNVRIVASIAVSLTTSAMLAACGTSFDTERAADLVDGGDAAPTEEPGTETGQPSDAAQAFESSAPDASDVVDGRSPDSGVPEGGAACDGTTCSHPVSDVYVDPISGTDTAAGDRSHPLRSITKALTLVESTGVKVIHLGNGTYGAANGDGYPLGLPDGVTLSAVNSGNVRLQSNALNQDAFAFAGNATVEGVVLADFATVMRSDKGNVLMRDVQMNNCINGFNLHDTANVTLINVDFVGGTFALNLANSAVVSMKGGSISGLAPVPTATVLSATNNARVSMDHVNVHDNLGYIYVDGNSTTSMTDSSILNSSRGGLGDTAVNIGGNAVATLTRMTVSVASGPCILVYPGTENVSIEGSFITKCKVGIEFAAGAKLKVRNTSVSLNREVGIVASGSGIDLGTSTSPGGNTFYGNASTGLELQTAAFTVPALGNTWMSSQQGTDISGHFASGTTLAYPASGVNMKLSVAGQSVTL